MPPDPEKDLLCCRLPLTDMGNAERWRVRFGDDFRFCPELGWLAWDSKRWRLLSEEKDQVPAEVTWSIARTVRAIRNEAALVAALGGCENHPVAEAVEPRLWQWARQLQEEGREDYLRGFPSAEQLDPGSGAGVTKEGVDRWLDEQSNDLQDFVVDFGKRKAWSTTIRNHAKTSEGTKVIGGIVKWVKGFPDVVVKPADLDRDRLAINVENGTLRLVRDNRKRSSEEIAAGKSEWHSVGWRVKRFPHNRADLLTKLAPVKYSAAATCPAYDAFIARVQPDETMRRFIHQWGGLSLTGDISEQKLAFFYGQGSNGKGTWVELVAAIAGDYAGSIPIESFLDNGIKRRGDQATPDIARLPGVRFLRVSEPEKNSSLNEGLIKMVTGGDPVDARHLNKGFFTFLPSFKMTISGNHKPNIKDTSDGIWRRMQLVPWDVQIPREERDLGLGAKLAEERAGVLNRLIEGLLDWRANGLIEPEQVRLATVAYRDQSDDLGRFLSALCEVGVTCRVGARELYEHYEAWAEQAGGAPWKIKGFKGAMQDKGFVQKQSDGMKWVGVRLREGVSLDAVKRGEWPGLASSSEAVGREGYVSEVDGAAPDDGWEGGAFDDEPPPGF